jgi:hypothetical protein
MMMCCAVLPVALLCLIVQEEARAKAEAQAEQRRRQEEARAAAAAAAQKKQVWHSAGRPALSCINDVDACLWDCPDACASGTLLTCA